MPIARWPRVSHQTNRPVTERPESTEKQEPEWKPDTRKPAIAGAAAGIVGLTALLAIGQIGDSEGRVLIEGTLPTTRFLLSSLITASATILALMLTVMSFTRSSDRQLSDNFFAHIRSIAFYDTLAFVGAVLFLLILSVPLEHGQNVPPTAYDILYYAMVVASCLLAGTVVTIVVRLYQAVDEMIVAIGIGKADHPLIADAGEDREHE